MANLFQLPPGAPLADEWVETLASGSTLRVERIVSHGQSSPTDFWYDQEHDEWVALLQGSATLRFADGVTASLNAGDWLLIPAHQRHRVEQTSSDPPCIWLAVHGELTSAATSGI